MEANWDQFESERPGWFTDYWKTNIPEELKPLRFRKIVSTADKYKEKDKEQKGGKLKKFGKDQRRRKSSALIIIGALDQGQSYKH